MTDAELKKLASYIVQEQARSKEWMTAYVREQNLQSSEPLYYTPRQAAQVLGISVSSLYKIKDAFTYIKSGSSKSSTLKFAVKTLQEEYNQYLIKGIPVHHSHVVGL